MANSAPFHSLITGDEWCPLPQNSLADGNYLVDYSLKMLLEYIIIYPLT